MRDEGSILIFTLLIIVTVSIIAVSLLAIVGKQKVTATHYQRNIENDYLIKAAITQAKTELQEQLESSADYWRTCDLEGIDFSGQLTIDELLTDDRVVIKYSAAKIVSESGKVNLNSIPQQDLGKLPGVGSILSARINKKRLEDSFLAQQELKTIKGIGAEKYRELKPLVTVNNQGKININTASRKVLKTMNGIAAITAANIVSYRQDNGAFSTTEALKNVSGIGDTTYQELAQKITVQSELFTVVFKISIPKRKMQEKITELVQVEVD